VKDKLHTKAKGKIVLIDWSCGNSRLSKCITSIEKEKVQQMAKINNN
jgi:hypothetical protein